MAGGSVVIGTGKRFRPDCGRVTVCWGICYNRHRIGEKTSVLVVLDMTIDLFELFYLKFISIEMIGYMYSLGLRAKAAIYHRSIARCFSKRQNNAFSCVSGICVQKEIVT